MFFMNSVFVLVCSLFSISLGNSNGRQSQSKQPVFQHTGTTKFYVDPSHSSIDFTIPFMGIAKVSGRFDHFFGEVHYDAEDIANSSVEIFLRAESIDTRNRKRDADVRKKYLEVDRFPVISFQSSQMSHLHDSLYTATGTLSLHGIRRNIEVPFIILNHINVLGRNQEMGLVIGPISIDRTDYGVTGGRLPGNKLEFTVLLRLREPFDKSQEAKYPEITLATEELKTLAGQYRDEKAGEIVYIDFFDGKLTSRFDATGDLLWNMWYEIVPYEVGDRHINFRFVNHSRCYITFDKNSEELLFRQEGDNAVELTMTKSN